MSQENSYNPTSSAFDPTYKRLKSFADNPLVKQFALKSFSEILAAENSFYKKHKVQEIKTEEGRKKKKIYEDILNTLEGIQIQSISFTADLMFGDDAYNSTLEIQEADVIEDTNATQEPTKTKPVSKLEVVKDKESPVVDAESNLSKESEESVESTLIIPAWQLDDKEIKAIIHENIAKEESKEILVQWLKDMVENKMFKEGSQILSVFTRAEFKDERYEKYIDQMIQNPATGPREKTDPKAEVTEIELPTEPTTFNKMKEQVKAAFKDNVNDAVIATYVDNMINKKLIKGGSDKVDSEKLRKEWIFNVKKGVENSRKTKDTVSDKHVEVDNPSQELLDACQNAENELKAGNRDKAIGIIKHYLSEYGADAKGTFKDLDIQRLLHWIDEDVFHHRNPMDILLDKPLGLNDVIKEVEKQIKLAETESGKLKEGSRKSIQSLIYSKVEGIKLREMESMDEVIQDEKEFNVWFEANCGFVFRDEELEGELDKQAKFEQDFEQVIADTDPEHRLNVLELVKKYKAKMAEFGIKLSLSASLKIISSKLESLNPKLKAAYEKRPPVTPKASTVPVLPAASELADKDTKSDEDGSSKENDSGTGSSESKKVPGPVMDDSFSKKYPATWKKTKKISTLEGLTNFILKNPEIGALDAYALTKEIMGSGQITDATTRFKNDELPTPWDAQQISNWFRLGPAKILESMDIVIAKNTVDFKKGMQRYITRNPTFGQEEVINHLSSLMFLDVSIRSNYVRKQSKHKNFRINLTKLYVEVLEENHVSTT